MSHRDVRHHLAVPRLFARQVTVGPDGEVLPDTGNRGARRELGRQIHQLHGEHRDLGDRARDAFTRYHLQANSASGRYHGGGREMSAHAGSTAINQPFRPQPSDHGQGLSRDAPQPTPKEEDADKEVQTSVEPPAPPSNPQPGDQELPAPSSCNNNPADQSCDDTLNPTRPDEMEDDDFPISKIVKKRLEAGVREFRVRWKASWVPENVIHRRGAKEIVWIGEKYWRIRKHLRTRHVQGRPEFKVRWAKAWLSEDQLKKAKGALRDFYRSNPQGRDGDALPDFRDIPIQKFEEANFPPGLVLHQSDEDFALAQRHLNAATWPFVRPRNDIDLYPAICLRALLESRSHFGHQKSWRALLKRPQIRPLRWNPSFLNDAYHFRGSKRNALLVQVTGKELDACDYKCSDRTPHPFVECVVDHGSGHNWFNGACANCTTAEANRHCCHHNRSLRDFPNDPPPSRRTKTRPSRAARVEPSREIVPFQQNQSTSNDALGDDSESESEDSDDSDSDISDDESEDDEDIDDGDDDHDSDDASSKFNAAPPVSDGEDGEDGHDDNALLQSRRPAVHSRTSVPDSTSSDVEVPSSPPCVRAPTSSPLPKFSAASYSKLRIRARSSRPLDDAHRDLSRPPSVGAVRVELDDKALHGIIQDVSAVLFSDSEAASSSSPGPRTSNISHHGTNNPLAGCGQGPSSSPAPPARASTKVDTVSIGDLPTPPPSSAIRRGKRRAEEPPEGSEQPPAKARSTQQLSHAMCRRGHACADPEYDDCRLPPGFQVVVYKGDEFADGFPTQAQTEYILACCSCQWLDWFHVAWLDRQQKWPGESDRIEILRSVWYGLLAKARDRFCPSRDRKVIDLTMVD